MANRKLALEWLYGELRKTKIAFGQAESRHGVKQEELDNLERKITAIDWVIPLVIKEDDDEAD